jgi:hypothetical protein
MTAKLGAGNKFPQRFSIFWKTSFEIAIRVRPRFAVRENLVSLVPIRYQWKSART